MEAKMVYTTRFGEYNGHKTMSIDKTEEGKRPFSFTFGKAKAQAILANIEAIKAFVSETEPTGEVIPEMVTI